MKYEWKIKTVGELTSYISKGIPPKYTDKKTNSTIVVLNQKCNRDYKISYEQSRLHDTTKKAVPTDKVLQYGDVLINSTGTGTAGRIAQFFNNDISTTVDGHMIIMRASKEIDYLYYGYALKSYQKKIESFAEGSTGQTEINKQRLQEELLIKYPQNIDLQRSIALILKNIDDKIELNNRINENLESQAQAIFKSWFVDFEPFGGVMPEDWKITTLGEISEMSAGGDKPRNATEIPTTENTVPIYSNGISNEGLYGFTDKAKVVEESVTVSARGTIGYVCLRQTPYVPIVRLITIVPKASIVSAKYIYLQLKTINISGTGTTQQQLTVPNFKSTELLMPNIAVVNKFTSIVNPMFEKIKDNKIENQRLSALRDALLPKLMNGEIDVSKVKI